MSQSGNGQPHWLPVELAWVPVAAGGRRTGPPTGPLYLPTARYADDPLGEVFSVGVRFRPEDVAAGQHPAELAVMFPDNLPDKVARLVPGARLVLHEGHRAVADVCVTMANLPAATGGR